jgi:hypothetical protein
LLGSLSLFLIFDDLPPYWGKIWVVNIDSFTQSLDELEEEIRQILGAAK